MVKNNSIILVTGATGHIGNVLVRMLINQAKPVRVLVRSRKPQPALEGLDVDIAYGDLDDSGSLRQAMRDVDLVFHLAAKISITSTPDTEIERINVQGTRNVLEMAREVGVRRLVVASSAFALRAPAEGVVDETCPFDESAAHGAYDRSKARASLDALQAAADGQDVVIASPTAVVGPLDFHGSEAGRAIQFNMPRGIKFYIDGGYDFVDVRDVACGMILTAEKGRKGQNYILGGEKLSIKQMSETVWEAAGGWHAGLRMPDWVAGLAAGINPYVSASPLVTPYSLEAVRSNSYISHEKAEQELGYHSHPARQAVRDAVRWWQRSREDGRGADPADFMFMLSTGSPN